MSKAVEPEGFELDADKLTRYLLNVHHPVGGPKAWFFIGRGFDPASPQELAGELLWHAAMGKNPFTTVVTPFGTKFVYTGPINAPDGSRPVILSVWIMATAADPTAAFVTAYPT